MLLKLKKAKFGTEKTVKKSMQTEWPIYFKDKLIIGDLDSNVGVATLWMPKENVADGLDSKSYSVCGQLYTKRGINAMLRNILANPAIRYLILCGVDRQGSGDALLKFFNNGVQPDSGKGGELEGFKILGDDEALLDKEITFEAFELVRKNVEIFDLRMKSVDEVSKKAKSLKKLGTFGDPQTFPEPAKSNIARFPSELSSFKIRRDFIGDAWIDVLKTIDRFGFETEGMYGKVKQVQNLSVVIEKEDPKNPKLYDYLNFKENGLKLYINGFFEKSKGSDPYTYGERIFDWDGIDQQEIMIKKMIQSPYDRGALAVLWKPHKDNFPPKKTKVKKDGQTAGWRVPCLVMILGQCIEHNFNLTAIFRNNDMYGAWPLNAFALRKFQADIAKKIGKSLGILTTISHIAEIYEIDWEMSKKVVQNADSLDRTCIYDQRCYYTISVEGTEIVATFFSPDGSVELAQYRIDGKKLKAGRDLCAMVLKDLLISELGAGMDFGRQVAKAETAIKLGLKFEQDKPLSR